MGLSDDPQVTELIALAVREDLGDGDRTSQLLPNPSEPASFELVAKEPGVLAGCEVAHAVAAAYDPKISIAWAAGVADGSSWDRVPHTLATIRGPLASLLSAERVLLNFLQHLSGIASKTRAFVDAVSGSGATILDTRKTTPGLRVLEKYAVRCGGGHNHRAGLFDAVLIKDNHLAGVSPDRLAYAVFDMLNRVDHSRAGALKEGRDDGPGFVQVECASLSQLEPLLSIVGIDSVLLDNFTVDELREAVVRRNDLGLAGKIALEASGGITLETVRAVAETGVERISVGAITHSAGALDLSLERITGAS